MSRRRLSWKDAITEVLRTAGEAMPYSAIADQISERKLYAALGATPRNTVNSVITQSIKNEAENSPFERVERGVYRLRGASQEPVKAVEEESEERIGVLGVVNAMGMFGDRENVSWSQTPRILGTRAPNSDPIDFCKQIGVYLLHDRQSVLYVGQTKGQNFGKRLWQHTVDRHKGRWDRFSWFGVYGVNANGTLQTGDATFPITIEMVIISMEAS